MDLRQISTFLEVAEQGSLRAASARLRVAETALSRQVRLLEQEFGVALFRRHGRGLALTAEGRAFRDRLLPLVSGLAQLRTDMLSQRGEISGQVAIGVPWVLLERLSAALARGFIRRHPAVTIRFIGGFADHLREALLRGEADLALMFDPAPSAALALSPLFTERMLLAAAPAAGYRLDRPVPFARVADAPLVLPGPRNPFRRRIEALAAERGLPLSVRFEAEALAPQKALALEGVAQMLASREAVRRELAEGRLCAAPIEDPTILRTLYLGLPQERPTSRAAAQLARAVVEEFGEAAASPAP
ncbi:LysR family transcriptional regulator [Rubritepida flocculans]|uniref:LysR family transcriptional regulator n=1 Tax=Rubritepida flocculans TaxID=182403 RepID=UPI0003F54B38|nr:LysR family transcriptional regulator [Rubritepida flocculans]